METIALPPHHQHHQHHPHHGYMGNNLSSPESAYSTGYSTDGTSPGASFPPEYYINIRTGTHYFHSAATTPTGHCNPLPGQVQRHLTNGHVTDEVTRDVRNGCVVEVEIVSASAEAFEGRRVKHASTPKVSVPDGHSAASLELQCRNYHSGNLRDSSSDQVPLVEIL
jgi:hypothetical protein